MLTAPALKIAIIFYLTESIIAKRFNFDYKIYVFLQYKFNDIE
ncbi:hypothetical protein [Arsenophonus endosymbiont of Bemisia tabaci]|nr:hypothetical protein [Arsenophonus endosymbiont of Bemisia tabaci]